MKILYSYLKPHGWLIVLALALASVNQIFSLMEPLIVGKILDGYAFKAKELSRTEFINGIAGLLGLSVGVAMVSRIAKNFQDYFLNVITQKMGAKIYQDGLAHSLRLPYQDFEDQRSGQTLSVLQKVRTDSERFIITFVNIAFISSIGFLFVLVYSLNISWKVTVAYMACVPIISFLSTLLSKKIKVVQKKIVSETTALAGATTESLRNIELIKSLGLAGQEEIRLNNTTTKILALELKKVRFIRSLSFIQGTTINLLRTVISFIMMYLIFQDTMTAGQYMSMMFYSFFIFGPLQELGTVINTYREAQISLANFETLMQAPPEEKPEHPTPIAEIDTLTFNHVSFAHKTATRKALDDISFEVKKGQSIAFVGPSGSGKSTLVKLLVGLYKPAEGSIDYNGVTGRNLDMDQFREKIGFVSQDTQLFSGTIRENLTFVNPNATDEQLHNVLQQAACHNLLTRVNDGLDSVIGEGGIKVSGGEKQRLSIARALLRNPQLLIFDEATSALDSLTEEEINQTIREVTQEKNQITVLIAHRLSTIMHADEIVVLEKGKIVEQGKHADLLEQKGLYYAMWRQQIGERTEMQAMLN